MEYFIIQISEATKTEAPTPAAPTTPETVKTPTKKGNTIAIYNLNN